MINEFLDALDLELKAIDFGEPFDVLYSDEIGEYKKSTLTYFDGMTENPTQFVEEGNELRLRLGVLITITVSKSTAQVASKFANACLEKLIKSLAESDNLSASCTSIEYQISDKIISGNSCKIGFETYANMRIKIF